ncbi:hypothetical protein C882_2358 [Caenispirillum salinarum AK4]|uniref:Uncharacterized protein n=1 Tax=Caenispirillum salinarum AK4 TaxID=1238182 RepID=K9HVM1_9PROT|nr:hypothetical protein [Caenispirillum salinarum]EKV32281.1 hypothetical protein C882_2358 [Caenispirillum salinarum AK4]
MNRLPWILGALSAGAAWLLWAGVLGTALMLPRTGGTWLPLSVPELIGGVIVSTVLFGACGYLFGRIVR